MRKHMKLITLTVVLAAAGWLASCNSTIDNEPNVVLEVETLTIPPVTSAQDSVNNTCTYTITAANGTFKNKPKNQFANTSPFNDIILQNVVITYAWDDALAQAPVTAGLGGAVPADGSATAQFSVVSNAALETGLRAGHTASLGMTFNGITVSGDHVSTTTGGTLQVNSCTTQSTGACCVGASCSLQTQANCTTAGGNWNGANSSCQTTVCN